MTIEWKPIDELWLRSQERFALGFKGHAQTLVEWIFFRVIDREYKNATPHTKSFNAVAKLGGTTNFSLLKDGDDEILDVTESFANRIMYHTSLGIKPAIPDLRVYTQFPTSSDLHRILSIEPKTGVGEDFAYVTALESPFDRPTEALEFFVPFNYTLSLAFANAERVAESSIFPSINVPIMAYLFEVLVPGADKGDDVLISQMARGAKKCRYKVIGPIENPAQYDPSLQKHLKGVEPISLADARKLPKGGA